MSGLDDREQRYAYLAAGLGAAASVAVWAHAFDERAGVALAGIGLAMAGLLAAAARRRSRLFTGIAAVVLSFGPWASFWLIGLPFLGLAAWLVVRAPRPEPRARRQPRPHRPSRRRRRASAEDEDDASPVPPPARPARPPAASKRYTPPQRRS